MEHKQKRDDLAGRQTRLRPAWRWPAGAQQRRLPLWHKRLAEIIDLAKNLDDPIQHHRLHHSAIAAYLKKLFRHNPLVARKPLIRVTITAGASAEALSGMNATIKSGGSSRAGLDTQPHTPTRPLR